MTRMIKQRRTVRDQLSRADRTVNHLSSDERGGSIVTFPCQHAAYAASGEAEGLNELPTRETPEFHSNPGNRYNE
jgi:hypothetical protein